MLFLVLAGIVVAFVWLNRELISQWWRQWFAGGDDSPPQSFDEFLDAETRVPPRTFASFRNPIGREPDPRRVIVITFQAFEAWSRGLGTARGRNETPSEFLRRVSQTIPEMSIPVAQVVDAYNRIVYGQGAASGGDLAAAEKVWQAMNSKRPLAS